MAINTLGDLLSKSTQLAGYRGDIPESDASFWANQAMQDMIKDVPFLAQEKEQWFSISSGDSRFDLPPDFHYPLALSWNTTEGRGSAKTLLQTSPEWADARGFYPVGEPTHYYIYGSEIRLWPSANSSANTTHASSGRSLKMTYRGKGSDLTALSSALTTHIDSEAGTGLLFKTTEYLHRSLGNTVEASEYQELYTAFTLSLKDANAKKQRARSPQSFGVPSNLPQRRGGFESHRYSDDWLRS